MDVFPGSHFSSGLSVEVPAPGTENPDFREMFIKIAPLFSIIAKFINFFSIALRLLTILNISRYFMYHSSRAEVKNILF